MLLWFHLQLGRTLQSWMKPFNSFCVPPVHFQSIFQSHEPLATSTDVISLRRRHPSAPARPDPYRWTPFSAVHATAPPNEVSRLNHSCAPSADVGYVFQPFQSGSAVPPGGDAVWRFFVPAVTLQGMLGRWRLLWRLWCDMRVGGDGWQEDVE